jgi:hypothetical protein
MSEQDLRKITQEKISQGGILAKMYFDVQDKDRERLQPILTDLIHEHLMKERGVVYCYGVIEEPLKMDEFYVTSATVTLLLENIASLVHVAFNYTPIGIEIEKPEKELIMKVSELQALALDVSTISTTYSKYILEKVLKPEDAAEIVKRLENRVKIGKDLMHKGSQSAEGSKQ